MGIIDVGRVLERGRSWDLGATFLTSTAPIFAVDPHFDVLRFGNDVCVTLAGKER